MPDRGPFIQTYTGKYFYLNDPRPEDIDIQDIAHALSNTCRFGGHSPHYYSVSEHSINVSKLVPQQFALWGLLHDSSEAYLPDIPSPFKPLFNFKEIEDRLLKAIIERFGLDWPMPIQVHVIDRNIVAEEARQLWRRELEWTKDVPRLDIHVHSLSPGMIKDRFMERFEELT